MISIDEALACYDQALTPLASEPMAIGLAVGRVLAEDITSRTDLPRFDQSAMDGYAIQANDINHANDNNPVALTLSGTAAAGLTDANLKLESGQAIRILTGGSIPKGADCVVPQEHITLDNDLVVFKKPSLVGKNIRRQGEELKVGSRLADTGQRCTPGLLAALIMGGQKTVSVTRLPRVAVFATGDELIPAGDELLPGQIHDSNSPLIVSWLSRRGIKPILVERLQDNQDLIKERFAQALAQVDFIITSGGVSVGDRDYVIPSAESLGIERRFWKVAQKPGKPIYFGSQDSAAFLGLPGNPGAVLIGLELHAARILDNLSGQSPSAPLWRHGRLAQPEKADSRRDRVLRMHLSHDEEGIARLSPLSRQDSHMLSNLSAATALVRLPARETDYQTNEAVAWIPLTQ